MAGWTSVRTPILRACVAIATCGIALLGFEGQAEASHQLSLRIDHFADGYDGQSLPITVNVGSTCNPGGGNVLAPTQCGDIYLHLEYDCAASPQGPVCAKEIFKQVPHAIDQEILFLVPGSDVEAPSFDFRVWAGQVEQSCLLLSPIQPSCSVHDVAYANAPASPYALESVAVHAWPPVPDGAA